MCSQEPDSILPATLVAAPTNRRLYAGVTTVFVLLVVWLFMGSHSRQEREPLAVKAKQVRPEPAAGPTEAMSTQPKASDETRKEEPSITGPVGPSSIGASNSSVAASAESSNSISASPVSPSGNNPPEPPAIPKRAEFPAMKLQGIIFSRDHPSAIINGVLVHPNDRLLGVRVVEIHSGSVTLEYQHQRKVLSLE